jgi:hypothetical protein
MSQNTTEYTIERYKIDLRRKEGLRLIDRIDYITYDQLDSVVEDLEKDGYIVNVFETYTTEKNLITGELYQERYDTPNFCSPSSESFWSM